MNAIAALLRRRYAEMKTAYMRERGFDVPARYQSAFVHWGGGAEIQHIFLKLAARVPSPARMLIVGAMGGRDYFLFTNAGYQVTAIDLGPQPDIPGIIIADVEAGLPFEDGAFDLVLASEVLEHLEHDTRALGHIRRVLSATGSLIVSLPYYNDFEEGHMRVHSPVSARRLLAMGGFDVDSYVERPALFAPNFLNKPQHALSLACYLLTGKTAYSPLTAAIGRFSWTVGRLRWPRPLRRRSSRFGGFFLCSPRAGRLDHIELNRSLYTGGAGLGVDGS